MKTVAKIQLNVDENNNPIVDFEGEPEDLMLASALVVKDIVEKQNLGADELVALMHFYTQMFLHTK